MSEVGELLQFLRVDSRADLRRLALDSIMGMSSVESSVSIFLQDDHALLITLLTLLRGIEWSAEAKAICLTLINAASFPPIREAIATSPELLSHCIGLLSPVTPSGPYAAKLLNNVSVDAPLAQHVYDGLDGPKFVRDTATRLTALAPDAAEADATYALYSAYVLRNMSQLKAVRDQLVKDELLVRFLPLTAFPGESKRKVLALEVIRNVAMDADLHSALLSSEELLVALLTPIVGGEELSEEENEALPLDLQYLPASKAREPQPALRLLVLESLYQLCGTPAGRRRLRDAGAYAVLRGCEHWETGEETTLACRNVIGLLIRTEEELGDTELHAVGAEEAAAAAAIAPQSAVIRVDEIPDSGLVRMD